MHDVLLIVRKANDENFRIVSIISTEDKLRISDAITASFEKEKLIVMCTNLTVIMKLENGTTIHLCSKGVNAL